MTDHTTAKQQTFSFASLELAEIRAHLVECSIWVARPKVRGSIMRHCAEHRCAPPLGRARDHAAVSNVGASHTHCRDATCVVSGRASLWHEERKRRFLRSAVQQHISSSSKQCAVCPPHRHNFLSRRRRIASTQASPRSVAASDSPRTPPTAKQLLLFALPTLILPLADPIMSLIDTVCIGMYGTVIELAATGPASLILAAPAVLFSAFSATALTDISRAQAYGDTAAAGAAFAAALRDAAVAGTLTMLLFGLCSEQVVGALSVAPDVLPHAAAYLAVRALAAPATMASSVCSVRIPCPAPSP